MLPVELTPVACAPAAVVTATPVHSPRARAIVRMVRVITVPPGQLQPDVDAADSVLRGGRIARPTVAPHSRCPARLGLPAGRHAAIRPAGRPSGSSGGFDAVSAGEDDRFGRARGTEGAAGRRQSPVGGAP